MSPEPEQVYIKQLNNKNAGDIINQSPEMEAKMLEFYKTYGSITKKIDEPESGSWINVVAPNEEEKNFLIEKIGVLPEFIK